MYDTIPNDFYPHTYIGKMLWGWHFLCIIICKKQANKAMAFVLDKFEVWKINNDLNQ